MNGKYLLDKMELIDPKYIEAAEKKPHKRIIMWQYCAALAACTGLMIFSGIDLFTAQSEGGSPAALINSASIFGEGSISLVVFICALLASAAVAAMMLKGGKHDE